MKKTKKPEQTLSELQEEYNEIRKNIKYAMTPRLAELINLIAEAEAKQKSEE